MRFFWRTFRQSKEIDEERLKEVESRTEALSRRADKVVSELVARQSRNQWTEAVQRISRRQV